jgi:putative transposase
MHIRKGYRYRIYPNTEQRRKLAVQFGHRRFVYNWGLALREEYYQENGKGLSRNDTIKKLPLLKAERRWLYEADSQALQQALIDLDEADQHYFDICAGKRPKPPLPKKPRKEGQPPGYPRFKSKHNRQSYRYPQARRIEIAGRRIRLPKVGWVKTVFHRPLQGKTKNVTVSKTKTGKYNVSFQVELEIPDPQPKAGEVGVDLGLKSYLALSSGETIANPGNLIKGERRLKKLQRDYARTQRGSRGREKARRRLARQHEKVCNQRRDFQHQLSRTLIARYGVIDRWYPSTKTGSHCLRERTELPLRVRQWQCPNCGVVHARDGNAAQNIARVGLKQMEKVGREPPEPKRPVEWVWPTRKPEAQAL